MTKPLGTPQNRETQDTQGTFYGHPIVIRVKDLTWQPPAQPVAAPQQDWVSNLLGEDPHEGDYHESLLVPPTADLPPEPQPVAAPLPPPQIAAVPELPAEPAAPAKPSYIHNSNESRQQRRATILSSQMKNRLALGGMAVSLLLVSFWALSGSGDSDKSPVEDVSQDLFVSTGELGDAPAWNANPAAADPSETITVEPFEGEIPHMASMPTRNAPANPMMSNPSHNTQLTNISTPDMPAEEALPDPYSNPAQGGMGLPGEEAPANQVWQFGPSNVDPQYEEAPITPYPNNGSSVPTGNVPSFDGSPAQPSQTSPLPSGPMDLNAPRTSQYQQQPAGGNDGRHWMQQEQGGWDLQDGKLVATGTHATPPSSGTELPKIYEGYQHQQGMPVVNNQMPENAPAPGAPQGNSQGGFGFGPYSGSSMPQEAAQPRARLGGIQPLDLESR